MPRLLTITAGLVCLATISQRAETSKSEELAAVPMADIVASLGSDDYTTRVEATRRLARAGSESIEAVKVAAAHTDPEVAWRVRMILVDIGINGDEATHQEVVDTLNDLEAEGHTAFQNLGQQVTRWRQIRSLPPEQQILQLNAFVRGGGVVDPVFFGRLRGC